MSSSSTTTTTGVTVIWDYQYCWIPDGFDLRTLKTSIETALKKCNPDFFIEGKLIAVGTATGDKHQAITMLPDDIQLSPMPPFHTRGPDRDLADQAAVHLVIEITMSVLARKANILVISGNYDVMHVFQDYSESDTFMMLAQPESSSSPSFYHFANVNWLWASEDPERAAATMVNGGGPIPPVPRVRG